ncbi:MAG: hypothetical protein ABJG23_20430 [Marinobacter sp.]
MNKYSPKIDDIRARVLDTESVLNFMRDRENLQTMLDHDSPEDPIRAMLEGAYISISGANELCIALQEAKEEDFLAEYKAAAIEAMDNARALMPGIGSGEDPDSDHPEAQTDIQAPIKESGDLTAGQSAMSPADNRLKELSDELQKAADTSAAISKVIESFMIERTYQSCPDWVESDFLLGGLIQANGILGNHICHLADSISYAREQGGES